MLRAKDVMSRDVIFVKKETPILEAVDVLVNNNISGMPVVRNDMTLAGILSEKDAIILFYEAQEAGHKRVGDYMTVPAVAFEENESLLEVCDFLAKNIFRRVPITSEGKLVGIISVRDVLDSVLKQNSETVGAT
ncbi:MAG: CBS domain-containing protein [Phycisphaerales bacterium]|nr:MAG: CBS domain-containing protein [Phycisphaerales bacterium]